MLITTCIFSSSRCNMQYQTACSGLANQRRCLYDSGPSPYTNNNNTRSTAAVSMTGIWRLACPYRSPSLTFPTVGQTFRLPNNALNSSTSLRHRTMQHLRFVCYFTLSIIQPYVLYLIYPPHAYDVIHLTGPIEGVSRL